jgi:predicted enzyme related to lactoylglutathione lyase
MPCELVAVSFDALDPQGLAQFWAGVLDWRVTEDSPGGLAVVPSDDTAFGLRFVPTQEPKLVQNQMHLDLTSTSLEDQQQTVAKALRLGARHVDIGQRPDEKHVVLADPEGNEFCVIEPGNNFLAGCGFLGAIVCDGSQQVGYFWSEALGWPLVWDSDQETAIQSPSGGTKISWGGEPPSRRAVRNRLHLDIAPTAESDRTAEVDRLAALGASRVESTAAQKNEVVMADPDGNEFWVGARKP